MERRVDTGNWFCRFAGFYMLVSQGLRQLRDLHTCFRSHLLRIAVDFPGDFRLLEIITDLEQIDAFYVLVESTQQFTDFHDFSACRLLFPGIRLPASTVGLQLLQKRDKPLDVQTVSSR
jgi:hypothetical protein